MRNDYKVRARNFLFTIYEDIKNILDDPMEVEQIMWAYGYAHHRKIDVKWGAARCAIITSDYVIKWDYDADTVEEIGGVELEHMVYEKAVKAGFGYLFAECTLIEVDGKFFEIMPRIRYIGRHIKKHWDLDFYLTSEENNFLHNTIIDTHSENWGLKNNYPVIVDYAFTVELTETW